VNPWCNKVLVADVDVEWRSALLEQLETHHLPREAIAITEHGIDVQRALLDLESPPTVLVTAHHLRGMGGLEAIYQARLLRTGRPLPERSKPTLCLIAEVRSDIELLDLLRKRGVRVFVQREDPLEDTVQVILNAHFGDMRGAPRYPVKIPVEIDIEGKRALGVIENISDGGCLLAVRDKKVTSGCTVGNQVGLRFEVEECKVACLAEIRQLTARRKLLGDLVLIGVLFDVADFDSKKTIETIVRQFCGAQDALPDPFSTPPGGRTSPGEPESFRIPPAR
jgi:hypothetical protein